MIAPLRSDTRANWLAANPVLAVNEAVVESDTGQVRVGNGVDGFAFLPTAGITADAAARLYPNPLVALDSQVAALITADGEATPAALGAAFDAVYTPEAFGAAGNGTTDDTTAVNACFAAAPVGGQVLLGKVYKVTTVTVNKALTIRGRGGLNSSFAQSSGLVSASLTADCLVINTHGCTLRDFAVVNSNTPSGTVPTAGAGIRFQLGDFSHLTRVAVSGFWNNVQYDSAWYYQIDSCQIYDPINYGLFFQEPDSTRYDHGDQGVTNTVISKVRDTVQRGTAVRWQAGGGLRFIGNKINAGSQPNSYAGGLFTYGLDLVVPDGVSTGVFPITGNSIENAATANIRVTQAGPSNTGTLTGINIVGNEIGFGNATYGILIQGLTTQVIRRTMIEGNNISSVGTGIAIKQAAGVFVGTNRIDANTVAVQIDPISHFVDVLPQLGSYTTNRDVIIDNRDLGGQFKTQSGNVRYDYDNQFGFTATGTWTQQFLFQPQNPGGYGSSCLVDVVLVGGDTANGPFFARYRRQITVPISGAAAPVVTTVDTDVVSGQIAAQFAVSGVGNSATVSVQVQVPAGAATPVCAGQAIFKATGMLRRFHVGT